MPADNLIARLRADCTPLSAEAADEIGRLREAMLAEKPEMAEILAQQTEIDRLAAENSAYEKENDEIIKQKYEIADALGSRNALKERDVTALAAQVRAERDRLQGENARLKAALDEIACVAEGRPAWEAFAGDVERLARAALAAQKGKVDV